MINRLIDMEPMKKQIDKPKIIPIPTNATMQEYAMAFIAGMGETQRNRFKKMLESGIKCGMSVAESYGIDYDDFITEVKNQLKVGVNNEL